MPENAAESVVEEQRKVPKTKNCPFLPFLNFFVIPGTVLSQSVESSPAKLNRRRRIAKHQRRILQNVPNQTIRTANTEKAFEYILATTANMKRPLKNIKSLLVQRIAIRCLVRSA